MSLTPDQVTHSHYVADSEAIRTKALRSVRETDLLITDLQHAIEDGRTTAAISLLASIDRANKAALDALRTAPQ